MSQLMPTIDVPTVLEEIQAGGGLTLAAVGKLFPSHRGPGTMDPATVFRWVTNGSKATDGRAVRLEAVRVGQRWLTSRVAVARYVSALTGLSTPISSTPVPTPAARQRRSEQAAAKLKASGA
ncbi:MAG TPA: DUF1580 domain-containing protein [Urbifossiella sp.]|jgi:hypothetical protein|nr:DUF1580 domain-containing protein [Urbifossiella sp.]